MVSSARLESVIVNMPDDVSPEPTISYRLPFWSVVLGLLLIMCVAALLRAQHMSEPLWLDELHTTWVVQGNLSDVADRAAAGNQGSLYFYAQWCVGRLVPPSAWRYRCLSLAAGLFLIPAMFLVTREICQSDWAGWVAAAITSVDRFSVIFSCEARPYSCVQLMTVVHLYLGCRRLQSSLQSKWLRAGWILTGALLFYLHYTAALILVAEAVAWLALLLARSETMKKVWRSLGIDLLGLGLLCSPALPHLAWINQRRTAWADFVSKPDLQSLLTLLPLLTYLAIPVAGMLLQRWVERVPQRQPGRGTWITLLTCCLLLPLVLTWSTTVSDVAALYVVRYLIGSLTISILLAASLVGLLRRTSWRFAIVPVLMIVVLLAESAISFSWLIPEKGAWPGFLHRAGIEPRQEEWSALVKHVNDHDADGHWPVFLGPDLIEDRQLAERQPLPIHARVSREEFCLFPVSGCYALRDSPRPTVALASRPPSLSKKRLDSLQTAYGGWFIIRGRKLARGRERARKTWQQEIEETLNQERLSYQADLYNFGSLVLLRLQLFPIDSLPPGNDP